MDIDVDYAKRKAAMDASNQLVAELRDRLLGLEVHPLSIIHAFFFSGLCPVSVSRLDNEEKLMVCGMLEDFVADTKSAIIEWRN